MFGFRQVSWQQHDYSMLLRSAIGVCTYFFVCFLFVVRFVLGKESVLQAKKVFYQVRNCAKGSENMIKYFLLI
jgi:hypothetical protein